MPMKVHVAADQFTQWWDGYICEKSEKVERLVKLAGFGGVLLTRDQVTLKISGSPSTDKLLGESLSVAICFWSSRPRSKYIL